MVGKQIRYMGQEILLVLRRGCPVAVLGIIFSLAVHNGFFINEIRTAVVQSVLYYLHSYGLGFYGMFLYVALAGIACGNLYYEEWNSRMIRSLVCRVGIRCYCISKVISSFVGGFMATVLAYGLIISGMNIITELADVEQVGIFSPFAELLQTGKYGLYLIILVLFRSIWGGLWSCFAMTLSTIFVDVYTCFFYPFFLFYLIMMILNTTSLSLIYRPEQWFSLFFFPGTDVQGVLACLIFAAVWIAAMILVCCRMVRWRLGHE